MPFIAAYLIPCLVSTFISVLPLFGTSVKCVSVLNVKSFRVYGTVFHSCRTFWKYILSSHRPHTSRAAKMVRTTTVVSLLHHACVTFRKLIVWEVGPVCPTSRCILPAAVSSSDLAFCFYETPIALYLSIVSSYKTFLLEYHVFELLP